MPKFPLDFEVVAEASSGIGNTWTAKADDFTPISAAIPPEFGGPGATYSPEDLFGISVLNCIIATFKVYAEHSGQKFDQLKSSAKITMDKDPAENHLAITHINIVIDVTGASDAEKVKKILEKAIKECAISNSVKSGKTFQLNVS